MAQSLYQHEWENRVILLFAPDFEDANLQQQIATLQKNKNGLKDRKLIYYQISPIATKKEDNILSNSKTSDWFERFSIDKDKFAFILIGLDGGEKMRSLNVVSIEKLFGKIDQMPMRRAEMRKKQ